FLDRTFHPHQPDTELVLDQLSDRARAAVAEMVDIVDLAIAVLALDQVAHDLEDVLACTRSLLERGGELELVIELEPADARQVVTFRIEEQVVEEGGGCFLGRGIARTQLLVDIENRFLGRIELVKRERLPQRTAAGLILGVEYLDSLDAMR